MTNETATRPSRTGGAVEAEPMTPEEFMAFVREHGLWDDSKQIYVNEEYIARRIGISRQNVKDYRLGTRPIRGVYRMALLGVLWEDGLRPEPEPNPLRGPIKITAYINPEDGTAIEVESTRLARPR